MSRIKKNSTRRNASAKVINSIELMSNLDNEVKRIEFLNKFVLCEIACKHIVEAYKRNAKSLKPGEHITLDMRNIPSALNSYDYSIPSHILNKVFGGSNIYRKSGTKSAKKLRDGVMHAMNKNDINEIIERETELMECMNSFLLHFGIEERK